MNTPIYDRLIEELGDPFAQDTTPVRVEGLRRGRRPHETPVTSKTKAEND